MNLVLIGAKSPRLFQKTIDQRRFAMIHVRDNCDIPNMLHTMLQLESLNLPVSSKRSSFLAAQIAAHCDGVGGAEKGFLALPVGSRSEQMTNAAMTNE